MLNKADVITALQTQLELKLAYQKDTLQVAIISRNSDTKSSAGDKFETSREMAQIEITKIEAEILKTQQFIQHLATNTAQLIITDKSIFYITIAFKIKDYIKLLNGFENLIDDNLTRAFENAINMIENKLKF